MPSQKHPEYLTPYLDTRAQRSWHIELTITSSQYCLNLHQDVLRIVSHPCRNGIFLMPLPSLRGCPCSGRGRCVIFKICWKHQTFYKGIINYLRKHWRIHYNHYTIIHHVCIRKDTVTWVLINNLSLFLESGTVKIITKEPALHVHLHQN